MRTYPLIGLQAPQILLPKRHIDYSKWAVVACDQYTSQPDYWQEVERFVADSPSTYWLILPEAYLGSEREALHQQHINNRMQELLGQQILYPLEGFVYLERSIASKKRKGLLAALDLERYDFHQGSRSLIRATEGTILERLPPRIKIRKQALLEIPHIMVLINDPRRSVIEPLSNLTGRMTELYDFELMQQGGHLQGFWVSDAEMEKCIVSSIEGLLPPSFEDSPFLFAVGDGNHSLAAAKSVWEEIKAASSHDHPARFALVEIVNIHDEGLQFEPIHRVLKGLRMDLLESLQRYFSGQVETEDIPSYAAMRERVNTGSEKQRFGMLSEQGFHVISLLDPHHTLPVGNLQAFLDDFLSHESAQEIDYIHGDDVLERLSRSSGCAGFYLPAMPKSQLFNTVVRDGALPRKTFSMGEANEKRFYLECRRIQPE